jgi:hypothetical protein
MAATVPAGRGIFQAFGGSRSNAMLAPNERISMPMIACSLQSLRSRYLRRNVIFCTARKP